MTLKSLVLALALKFPATPADRADPSTPVIRERAAQGITEACAIVQFPGGEGECAAYLLVTGKFESNFAINVQAGRCARHQCDPRKSNGKVVWLARSWWQLHRNNAPLERWNAIVGLDQEAISQAAILAAERLRSARYMCAGEPDVARATFVAYGGAGCRGTTPTVNQRVAEFRRVRARL